jgi:nucleotide-binding universal stress UspA family protein
MRLLVAHDGRDGGRDALELARVLAGSAPQASALAVTILHTGPLPIEYALLPEEEATEGEPILAEARDALVDLEVETRAYGGGSPAGILTRLAERERFDAIVVGSPHRGAIGRVVLGSVAQSLLNGAPVDVAVAPAGYAQETHERVREIAVGYDGSPESELALRRAEALAKRANAEIELITVVTPPVATPVMVPGAYVPEAPPEPDKVIDQGIHSVSTALAAVPIRRDGDPAIELLRSCEEDVDLLVVGSRGYGPLARVLLGSVSREVIRKAPCPVLMVRRPK